jgi:serine/threonine-protein kinase
MALSSLPVYAADPAGGSGHVLFVQDGVLMSQRFDPAQLKLIGEPVRMPVADRVHAADVFPAVSASAGGAIAFRRAATEAASVVFVGRDGKESGSIATGLARAEHPRLSPDARSLALIVARELWKYDVDGRPPVKLTFNGALSPVWSRDGRRIVYEGDGGDMLRVVMADGSSKAEDVAPKGHFHPHSFTADSREVVAFQFAQGNGGTLVSINLQNGAKPQPIVEGGFSAALSPDGRWLAYTSETTGSQEIWVQPYPGPGAPIRVSPNRGTEPVWARNGKELYYLRDKTLMAVSIDSTNGFNFKPAAPLFETTFLKSNQPPSYDVTPDGRFIMLKSTATTDEPITVIFNPVFSDARAR